MLTSPVENREIILQDRLLWADHLRGFEIYEIHFVAFFPDGAWILRINFIGSFQLAAFRLMGLLLKLGTFNHDIVGHFHGRVDSGSASWLAIQNTLGQCGDQGELSFASTARDAEQSVNIWRAS